MVGSVAARPAFELQIGRLASGNIADGDREACPDKLVQEAGTATEKRADVLIVSLPEDAVDSDAGMLGDGLVIVWKTQGELSARLGIEELIEACLVAAAGSEEHDQGKAGATEVYHTLLEVVEQALGIEKVVDAEEADIGYGTTN
jgi:hypothetical protein